MSIQTVTPPAAFGAAGMRATTSVEHERAAARAAGYAAGWSAGAQAAQAASQHDMADRRRQADAEAAAATARLTSVLEALSQAAGQARAVGEQTRLELSQAVLDTALQLAAAVLGHEPLASENPGRDALKRALAAEPGAVEPVVRLNPDDAATISALDIPSRVRVVADSSLSRGDSVLDHAAGRASVVLADALARAKAVLLP